MNMNSGRSSRKITAVVAMAFAVTMLAGCSTLSYEEAQASDHRVVQTDYSFLEGRSWTYIGPSGREVPLTEDCRDGFFSQRCRGSADGSIQFRWSKTKHGTLISESITVNGEEYRAECLRSAAFANDYTCAPEPAN